MQLILHKYFFKEIALKALKAPIIGQHLDDCFFQNSEESLNKNVNRAEHIHLRLMEAQGILENP